MSGQESVSMFTQSHRMTMVASMFAVLALSLAAPSYAKRGKQSKRAKAAAAAAAEAAATEAAAAEVAAAEAAAIEAAKPPPPGYVNLASDATGLVAEFNSALHGLKEGNNRYELPVGDYAVVVTDGAKKEIAREQVRVESKQTATVTVVTKGKVIIAAGKSVAVQIDGKAAVAKDGKVESTVVAGKHSVVITEPGMIGREGALEVTAGKTHMVSAKLSPYDAGSKTAAWAGVIGGGGLILTAVLLEAFADPVAVGGDATRWALVGVGTTGFVSGTIMMKGILKREANPPVKKGKLNVKISAGPQMKGAAVAMRF